MASLYENRTWIIPGGGNVGSGHSIGANESRHITLRPGGMDQAFTEVEILMLNPTTSVYQVTHASVGNLAATTKTENIATGFKTLVSSPVNVPAGDGLLNEGLDSILPGIVSLGRQTLSMAGGNGFQLAISMSEGAPLCIWGGEAIGYEWGLDKIPRDLSVTWSLDGGQNPFNVNPCIAVIFYGLSTPVVTLPFVGDSWIKSWGDLEQPFPGARGIPYRLEQRWRTANVNISPVNFGRDGATTSVIAARAGWVLDNFAPRVLAVQYYSINNDMQGVGNANVESNFQGIVDAMYPQPVLPLLLAGNNNGTSGWWAPVKALEDACVAARPETVDLSAPIVDETDGTIVSGYEYGTSHPNTDAYDVMEASSHLAIRTWCENYVEPVVEKFYSLRNTTLSSITLAGTETIAPSTNLRFYDTATDMFDGMDAIQQSMLSDATGVNYLLATGDLEFYEDGVASTSAAFYEIWDDIYASWLEAKQTSLYHSVEEVLEAEANGAFVAKRFAIVAGGAVVRKVDGLWVGNIGTYASALSLPATTHLGIGCTAYVGTAATGYDLFYIMGANGTRVWSSDDCVYSVKSSLTGSGNLFVVSEQVVPDIIENKYIGASGEQVDGAGVFYVSKPVPVTPGDLLVLSVTNNESFLVAYPISFWTFGMAWIATPNFNIVERSYGQLVAPAGAAYARLNVVGSAQHACFLGVVKQNPELCKNKPTKLVALGDSITAGIADVHDSSDLWWKIAGRQAGFTDFVTLAVEGNRMSAIIANQLPNIPADADVIQLMTGIPDYVFQEWPLGTINDTISTPTFYGGLQYAVEYISERHPLARLILCTPIKWRTGLTANNSGNSQDDYAEAVRLVAAKYCLQLVDFYDGLGVNWTTQRNAEMYLDSGLLHPNKLGNMLMANKYVPVLKDKTGITTRVEAKPVGQRRTVRHAAGLRNIFVRSEQVAPDRISDTYIGLSGEQVSSTFYAVSKAYPVTPGQLLAVAPGSDAIDIPVSFWTASMVWISTPVVSVLSARTYGLIQVPANAAFVRLNYAARTESITACYVVPQNQDLYNTRSYPRKLLAIGDSLTAGTTHTDETNLWWKIAAENAGYTAVNEGRDGALFMWYNTNSIAYRAWNREYAEDADVMLVMAGINDWAFPINLGNPTDAASTFASSFYGSLRFTAGYLREYYPLTKHIWCSPFKCAGGNVPNSYGATLADYAKAIIHVATEFGFTAIDLYNDFYDLGAYPYRSLALTYDAVHLNIVGHRLLSNHVQPYIEAGGSFGIPYMLTNASSGSGAVAAVLTDLSTADSTDVVATDSILVALGKLQARNNTAAYLTVSAAGGIGYNTGSGGTVTQVTSKSTGVTLNKLCGTITMNGVALTANTSVAFTLTNSTIANTDMVLVQHNSVGTLGSYGFSVTPGAGSALITVRNNSSSSRSEAIVLRFFVLKAAVA